MLVLRRVVVELIHTWGIYSRYFLGVHPSSKELSCQPSREPKKTPSHDVHCQFWQRRGGQFAANSHDRSIGDFPALPEHQEQCMTVIPYNNSRLFTLLPCSTFIIFYSPCFWSKWYNTLSRCNISVCSHAYWLTSPCLVEITRTLC